MAIRFMRIVGWLLSIAGLVFVCLTLIPHWEAGSIENIALGQYGWLGFVTAIYTLSLLLPAIAWVLYLRMAVVGNRVDVAKALQVYCRTQIGKYVPGNIMHLVARHVVAAENGWSQGAVGAATIQETATVTGAAAFLTLGAALIGLGEDSILPTYVVGILAGLALLAMCAPLLVARGSAFLPAPLRDRLAPLAPNRHFISVYLKAFLLVTGFFAIMAVLFALLARQQGINADAWLLLRLASAYVLAWVAGFVTPGAPAGLGVREGIILLLLGGEIGEATAAAISLLFRVVTTIGDLLLFVGAVAFGSRHG